MTSIAHALSDPVAHFVLSQSSVGDGRRKVIKACMKNRQIHDEIDRQAVTGACRCADAYVARRFPVARRYGYWLLLELRAGP